LVRPFVLKIELCALNEMYIQGGTYLLYEMRKAGYKTVLYDAGTSFGGTWRWNVYRELSTGLNLGDGSLY
jgi:hypothetical protein